VSFDFWETSAQLALLYGARLDDLVRDAKHSLRFFYLDPIWLTALECVPTRSDECWPLAGFLLRSQRVAGWRGLELRAFANDGEELPVLRIERPSPDALLGLFNGQLARLTLRPSQAGTDGIELVFPREELLRGVSVRRVLKVAELTDATMSALSVQMLNTVGALRR
jgi:hypothetical protein